MFLLALVALAASAVVVGCNKEEETSTYTAEGGLVRMRGVDVFTEIVPPDSIHTMTLVHVKAGTFIMGSFDSTGFTENQEKPYHIVNITKDFLISQTEVTQAVFQSVMGYNPSLFVNPDNPVENVTYEEAVAFCDSLTQNTGIQYSLPTEAQWEYAARGGHLAPQQPAPEVLPTYLLYAGSYDVDSVAWYRDNADSCSHPVAQKKPNVLGLYDMSGNVWEWCSDWYGPYPDVTQFDPTGPAVGTYRVRRGGGWYDYDRHMRPTFRIHVNPTFRYSYLGFRVVRAVE